MSESFNKIQLTDKQDQVVISLNGNDGNYQAGGNGHDGDIMLLDTKGRKTIHLNAADGALLLGGPEQDGDLKITNAKNQQTIHLNGRSAGIHLGGHGEDGDIFIKDAEGSETIIIDGKTGDIKLKGETLEGADFVFAPSYELPSLEQVEQYISQYRHLPAVPSADQMKKEGISVQEFSITLLQKVEELTLYVIEQQKMIAALQTRLGEIN